MWSGNEGSLNDYGIEIKSSPATWEWIKAHRNKYKPLFELDKRGFTSSVRTGMHVHCSHESLSGEDVLNIMRFVYRNKNYSRFLSGRPEDSRYASLNVNAQTLTRLLLSGEKNRAFVSKSWAVSFHEFGTLEFRLFQGTVKEDEYWARVEAVHTLVSATKNKGKELSVKEFMDAGATDETPYLWTLIRQSGPPKKTMNRGEVKKVLDMSLFDLRKGVVKSLLAQNGLYCCDEHLNQVMEKVCAN